MNVIFSILLFLRWDNLREYLSAKPMIGISASAGTSIVSLILSINPLLQFVGLCAGLFIAWLTAEAKLEERKLRRAGKGHGIDPVLSEKMSEKTAKALKLRGK